MHHAYPFYVEAKSGPDEARGVEVDPADDETWREREEAEWDAESEWDAAEVEQETG